MKNKYEIECWNQKSSNLTYESNFFIYWQQSVCIICVSAHFCPWIMPKEQTTVAFDVKLKYISKSILALCHLAGLLLNWIHSIICLTRAQKICCQGSFWFVNIVWLHSSSFFWFFFQLCFSSPAPVSQALKLMFCFKYVLNSLSTSCSMSLSFWAFLIRERIKQVHKCFVEQEPLQVR